MKVCVISKHVVGVAASGLRTLCLYSTLYMYVCLCKINSDEDMYIIAITAVRIIPILATLPVSNTTSLRAMIYMYTCRMKNHSNSMCKYVNL